MNSVANLQEHKLEAAEKSARETIKLDTEHRFVKIGHVLGVILAQKQDYPAALAEMKGYLAMRPDGPDAEVVRKQVADLEKMTGASSAAQRRSRIPRPLRSSNASLSVFEMRRARQKA